MEVTIIKNEMTNEELKEYIENIKHIYNPDKITVVDNMNDATKKIVNDIRNF